MTEVSRDRQLLREAEGYLDLALASAGELPLAMRQQLCERCLKQLDRLTPVMAARSPAMMLRGQALRMAERFDEAVDVLNAAIEKDDENVHLYLALGWCHKRLGNLQLAIESLEEALLIDSDEPILYYNLACYWALAGDIDGTVRYLARALDLNPNLRELIPAESDFDRVRHEPKFLAVATATV